MKLIILFIACIFIAITIWIGVSLLGYYLRYCKGDSMIHFINLLQANYELHELKVKRQIKANTITDLVQVVEVEEVQADDIPLRWKVVYNDNSTQYSTEVQKV